MALDKGSSEWQGSFFDRLKIAAGLVSCCEEFQNGRVSMLYGKGAVLPFFAQPTLAALTH